MSSRAVWVTVLIAVLGLGTWAQGLQYLWAEVPLPEGAVGALAPKAAALGVPVAKVQDGTLVFPEGLSEADLRAGGAYLYLDGDFFLLGVETPTEYALLRGDAKKAELIVIPRDGLVPPSAAFFELAGALRLLSPGATITLTVKEVPLKLPRVPAGVRLDPVLWALVGHPDWFGAARDSGLERVGLRVRVVAEGSGALAESLEPYVLSSTGSLIDLLIPIPLLPALAQDPAVRYVRPPYTPHP
ncbi:MAG: hypothetical protein N2320_02020 [Candidatus Bipolaricaulota bacterium]|nr:hypothetical protein [Candidatus Bipolaricaulota bacterium]